MEEVRGSIPLSSTEEGLVTDQVFVRFQRAIQLSSGCPREIPRGARASSAASLAGSEQAGGHPVNDALPDTADAGLGTPGVGVGVGKAPCQSIVAAYCSRSTWMLSGGAWHCDSTW